MTFKFNKDSIITFKERPMRLQAPSGYYYTDGVICLHEYLVDNRHKYQTEHTEILSDLMVEIEKEHETNPIAFDGVQRVKQLDRLHFDHKNKVDLNRSTVGLSNTVEPWYKTEYRVIAVSIWEQLGNQRGFTYNFRDRHGVPIVIAKNGRLCGVVAPFDYKENGVWIDKAYQELQNKVNKEVN